MRTNQKLLALQVGGEDDDLNGVLDPDEERRLVYVVS